MNTAIAEFIVFASQLLAGCWALFAEFHFSPMRHDVFLWWYIPATFTFLILALLASMCAGMLVSRLLLRWVS